VTWDCVNGSGCEDWHRLRRAWLVVVVVLMVVLVLVVVVVVVEL
jgi:hypothetical protein